MAGRLSGFRLITNRLFVQKQRSGSNITPSRNVQVFTEAGGVRPKPETISFGLAKVLIVTIPFLIFGATISKNGAAFLEENEIFVPEDDDD